MENLFLGKQPILDRNRNLIAYELLFRSGRENAAEVSDDVHASANVVVNAYGHLGIQQVLGSLRGFINIGHDLLLDDAILLLPTRNVVLELLETISATPEIVQRCVELKQMGYQLALDDVIRIDDRIRPLLPVVNIVKVDVLVLNDDEIKALVRELRTWPVILLAEKVDSPERAGMCMDLGFEMFQGYFFAKPEIVSGKRVELSSLVLFRLLMQITRDEEVGSIEQIIKREPVLSYNLLRMVNSAAAALPRRISSIRQAVLMLGYRHLYRWVQLLLYAAGPNRMPYAANALMQTAAIRGRLMELIAATDRPHDKAYQERAFMAGIMSLLDTLLGTDMQQIVDRLTIPDEVTCALLSREGKFGCWLRLIEAREGRDAELAANLMKETGFLEQAGMAEAELTALNWATHVNQPAAL